MGGRRGVGGRETGSPPWSFCHEKSRRWHKQREEEVAALKRRVPGLWVLSCHPLLQQDPPLPGLRTRHPQPPVAGHSSPLLSCLGLFVQQSEPSHPCPLPTTLPTKGWGSCSPSPIPSPKAQAPWQRPRRQGGVCQRHLSLTSSITGHQGNTHDSTQEGLPVQPFLPSLHQASAEPKVETPFPLGSEKSQFFLPTLDPRLN